MKKLILPLFLGLIVFGLSFGGAYYYHNQLKGEQDKQVETIVHASIPALKEQGKITAFVARYVAVMTSPKAQAGDTAQAEQSGGRMMIVPGLVRYELDLNSLRPQDVKWDKAERVLTVRLPALSLAGPELEMAGIRLYGGVAVQGETPHAEDLLDDTSRKQAEDALLKEAKGEEAMDLAREAARNAIIRSFTMPMRASGIKAAVEAKFADEQDSAQGEEHQEGM